MSSSLKSIDTLLRRGALLEAHDQAMAQIADLSSPGQHLLALQHRAILSLLRAGAIEHAALLYKKFHLDQNKDDEDILALGGRLLKDRAFSVSGTKKQKLAHEAAQKYDHAYQLTDGLYSAINAATLYLISGERDMAHNIASKLLQQLFGKTASPGEKGYYHLATLAEAHLILGNLPQSVQALTQAMTLDKNNYAAHATTLKQFGIILDYMEQDKDWLDHFRPPHSLQYTGHLFLDKYLHHEIIINLRQNLSDKIKAENIGWAYGALAAGSDIIIAETMLENNCELYVVLPVPEDIFIARSVTPYGKLWQDRYNYCRSKASSVQVVFDNLDYMDILSIVQANKVSMGMALLKAQSLESKTKQLILWDQCNLEEKSITALNYSSWKESISDDQIIMDFPSSIRLLPHEKAQQYIQKSDDRTHIATIFVDIQGFTKLKESELGRFIGEILTPMANYCADFRPQPDFLNTWGDGLFLAFHEITDAAQLTTKLQELFRTFELKALDFPDHLSLRIGCHYGIARIAVDPFLQKNNLFGADVSLAARIEPVTPPGSIYVSQHFACELAISDSENFRCEYIGRISVENDKPKIPLFSLQSNSP